MNISDRSTNYLQLILLGLLNFFTILLIQELMICFGQKDLFLYFLKIFPLIEICGFGEMVKTILFFPFLIFIGTMGVCYFIMRRNRKILKDWNKRCFEKWKRFEFKTDPDHFQIIAESPEKLDAYKECKSYLEKHYSYILEEWEQLENAVKEFNENSKETQKNLLKRIDNTLKSEFKGFSNEKTETNSYYLINSFFSVIYNYQRCRPMELNEFIFTDQIYNGDFKIITHKWTRYNLIRFQKDMNSNEIMTICKEIIKSKDNENLNFDSKIDEIRKNLFDSVIKRLKLLSEKIENERSFIKLFWIP